MFFMDVNLWAVLVAAVATMVLGFLWYSPAAFRASLDAGNGLRSGR